MESVFNPELSIEKGEKNETKKVVFTPEMRLAFREKVHSDHDIQNAINEFNAIDDQIARITYNKSGDIDQLAALKLQRREILKVIAEKNISLDDFQEPLTKQAS
jgi:DNA primase catalytic subunit